tara:strand:+ start:333 stop:722 length:390 start_codon:yes stop_codon:yes gene_type:complete
MASILRVNTLTDASSNNSTPMATINQGTAKAWSHHTSVSSTSLEDSFNCSSIADNGTGNSTITMSSAMGNDDYSCSASSGIPANSGYCDVTNSSTTTFSLRSFNIVTSTATITIADVADNSCTVLGDLA